MNRIEFFKKACHEGLYKQRRWVISAFTVVQEGADDWKKDPYDYRIVQTPTGIFFVDPEGPVDTENKTLSPLEGKRLTEAPFHFREAVELKIGELPNVKKDIITTLGNMFFNLCAIIPAFGPKLEFITDSVKISNVESEIAKRLKDTPGPDEARNDNDLYVDEYIRFCDSFAYLTEFTQVCTIAITPKAITQAPGTIELRNKLLEENKDKLDDPAVVARIEAVLLKHDAEYLKDDPSENFLITKKSRNVVRKKLFLDYGADPGLTTSFKVDLIAKSLSEGWDVNKLPTMIRASRAASYDRGAETQLGGEAVKWLYRASSNVNIIDTDCGARLGLAISVNEYNKNKLVGMNVITQTSTKLVKDANEAGQYLGKRLMVRSPMYCKLSKTDYCKVCVGERLGANPNSGATAVSRLGSVFLALSLKKFHAVGLSLERATLEEIMS